ncbi:MAG: hypothetical protein U9Q03_04570 [Patescibacteria group bacterium]|nr:hypothetical protein [Patescibacteria group bacterium]
MSRETLCDRCRSIERVRTDLQTDDCVCGRKLKDTGDRQESYRCEVCARREGVCKWCGGAPVTTA